MARVAGCVVTSAMRPAPMTQTLRPSRRLSRYSAPVRITVLPRRRWTASEDAATGAWRQTYPGIIHPNALDPSVGHMLTGYQTAACLYTYTPGRQPIRPEVLLHRHNSQGVVRQGWRQCAREGDSVMEGAMHQERCGNAYAPGLPSAPGPLPAPTSGVCT